MVKKARMSNGRKKIIAWLVMVALCLVIPMAYMIMQDFREVGLTTRTKIILTVMFMSPSLSLMPLEIWSFKKRGEGFDLLEEWYR